MPNDLHATAHTHSISSCSNITKVFFFLASQKEYLTKLQNYATITSPRQKKEEKYQQQY